MNKKVFDYFVDLDRVELPREDGVLFCDNQQIRLCENIKNGVNKYYIDSPICKSFYSKDLIRPVHIAGYVSSKMYNELGILTPPQYIMKRPSQPTNPYTSSRATFLAQSVFSITGLVVKSALHVLDDIKKYINHHPQSNTQYPLPIGSLVNKWEILHNKDLQGFFLEFCTPECLDELIGLFLLDEIRGDLDRHGLNYFFYKHLGADKFEGIMPIDLDNMNAAFFYNLASTKENFYKSFLPALLSSYTPQQTADPKTNHKDRVTNVINEIQRGNFSKSNITLLKSMLEHDLPDLTKKILDSHPILTHDTRSQYSSYSDLYSNTHEPINHLWEYNRRRFEHVLDL